MEIISKKEAKAIGSKFYFTGKPCPKNHLSVRRVCNGACEECLKTWALDRYHSDPEPAKEMMKAWRIKNKEHTLEYSCAWRKANPDKYKQTIKEWRTANPEKVIEMRKNWTLENYDRKLLHNQNYRASKRSTGKLSLNLSERLFRLQKGLCACCGQKLGDDYHLDHIMPLVLGGANEDSNMQLLRAKCNMQKHSKHPADFMRERGYLI